MAFLECGWDAYKSSSIWEFFLHPAWSGKSHPVQSSLSFYSVWSLFLFLHSESTSCTPEFSMFWQLSLDFIHFLFLVSLWCRDQQPEAIFYVLTSLWPIPLGPSICCLFFFYKENFFLNILDILYIFQDGVFIYSANVLCRLCPGDMNLWSQLL